MIDNGEYKDLRFHFLDYCATNNQIAVDYEFYLGDEEEALERVIGLLGYGGLEEGDGFLGDAEGADVGFV